MPLSGRLLVICSSISLLGCLMPWGRGDLAFSAGMSGPWGSVVLMCSLVTLAGPWLRGRFKRRSMRRNLAVGTLIAAGVALLFSFLYLVSAFYAVGVGALVTLVASIGMVWGATILAREEGIFE